MTFCDIEEYIHNSYLELLEFNAGYRIRDVFVIVWPDDVI